MIGGNVTNGPRIVHRGITIKQAVSAGIAGILAGSIIIFFGFVRQVNLLDYPLQPECHKLWGYVVCPISDSFGPSRSIK